MSNYNKPYLDLPDQLNLLKQRGLRVRDEADAIKCLRRNGYYRLSAYWYPFREIVSGRRTDNFLDGSCFEDALELYIFDKKFKLQLLDAIERVEIAVRVEIGLMLGARDRFALANPKIFHTQFTTKQNSKGRTVYEEWMRKYETAVTRSRDEFVLHYERRYGSRSPLPIWIAIELWDFGLLSHLFSGLKVKDRQAISSRFAVPHWKLMQSWLRCLNYVRNVIAHHGRLWNLNLSENPKLPRKGEMPNFDHLLVLPNVNTRVYSICSILCYLSHIINPRSSWRHQLLELVQDFPTMPHCSSENMGFPNGWERERLWK